MRLVGDYDEFEGEDDADQVFDGPDGIDQHLRDDDIEETVPCAHCGRDIWSYSERCPHCGVYFRGEAWEFKVAGEVGGVGSGGRSRIVKIVVVLVIIVGFLWLMLR